MKSILKNVFFIFGSSLQETFHRETKTTHNDKRSCCLLVMPVIV